MKVYDDEEDDVRPKAVVKDEDDEADDLKPEKKSDPDEAREREIGTQQDHLRHLVSTNIDKYKYYLEKVKAGDRANPFLLKPMTKKSMLKHYRRYIFYFVSTVWIDMHPELGLKPPAVFAQSLERIKKLNEELVTSLKVISSMPKKVITRARNRDNMFVVPKRNHNPFLSKCVSVIGDMEISCSVPECLLHKNVSKIFALENPHPEEELQSSKLVPAQIDKEKQIVPLCRVHAHFFELIYVLLKMDFNVKSNMEAWIKTLQETGKISNKIKSCEDVCNMIPVESLKNITIHFLSVYAKLFAFGTTEDWSRQSINIKEDSDDEEEVAMEVSKQEEMEE